ncbi:2-hydroxyacid dehydrogenase [Niveispirillum cyanobacteriorum]|uniref:Glyoxylate/hydroxypyruvate reductase A n=1 Tax=Niveispirillum cyanobacteriorum TaxID=1612173 RepID=A0A2K9NK43_9PROT|nr:glyoxylate/hydroxypyruvate reductase A [Niveispirillum cyanobacteriorum]AUN33401.1 glyoxylate/hydroxypyruvate reductase A [Niveispirillum cyanobacteriorum]GGE48939.1 glyoxylate/hydroxypyruvate reductase A [Niveispirillum cyanobacteriorum]
MKPPVLLYACPTVDQKAWVEALNAAWPGIDIRLWPDTGDKAEIDYALVWKQPAGILSDLPNLKVIFSLGAGVEHVLTDTTLPADIPLVRMVDPTLVTGMVEFVVMQVLHYHRSMPDYAAQQRAGIWKQLPQLLPSERRIGILGMGELGAACAKALTGFGFDVAGWSRTAKDVPGVRGFAGREQLDAFLAQTDILVCLLPLTDQTRGILNRRTLSALPRGSYLINAARGGHLVEDDLIPLLDAGHLSAATLDVFAVEPLPVSHPFWTHPKITLVPHAAALTHPGTASRIVAANIDRHRRGEPLHNVVDRTRGY